MLSTEYSDAWGHPDQDGELVVVGGEAPGRPAQRFDSDHLIISFPPSWNVYRRDRCPGPWPPPSRRWSPPEPEGWRDPAPWLERTGGRFLSISENSASIESSKETVGRACRPWPGPVFYGCREEHQKCPRSRKGRGKQPVALLAIEEELVGSSSPSGSAALAGQFRIAPISSGLIASGFSSANIGIWLRAVVEGCARGTLLALWTSGELTRGGV